MATYGPTNVLSDATLNIFTPTTNDSASSTLQTDGQFSNTLHRAVLKFNVSSIPVGSTISAATLALRVTSNTSISGTGTVYPITRAFTMSAVCWDNYDIGLPWTTGGGDYAGGSGSQFTFDTSATPFTHSISVTTAVRAALLSYRFSGTIGLLVRRDVEPTNPGIYWSSSLEGATPPTLSITYLPPAGGLSMMDVGT